MSLPFLRSPYIFIQPDNCGFWITNLCNEDDPECMKQDDLSSEITLPEPVAGHSNNGYRMRIAEVGTEKFRCSEDFYLMGSADALAPGEAGGPSMAVISPDKGAMAVAGEIYTVEVRMMFFFFFLIVCGERGSLVRGGRSWRSLYVRTYVVDKFTVDLSNLSLQTTRNQPLTLADVLSQQQ